MGSLGFQIEIRSCTAVIQSPLAIRDDLITRRTNSRAISVIFPPCPIVSRRRGGGPAVVAGWATDLSAGVYLSPLVLILILSSSVLQRRTWPLSLLHVSRGPSWSRYHPRYPFSLLEGIWGITSITPLINQSIYIVFVMFLVVYLTSRYYNDKKMNNGICRASHHGDFNDNFFFAGWFVNCNKSLIRIHIFLEVKYYIEEDAPLARFFKKLCITILTYAFLYLGLTFFITKTQNVLFFIIGNSLFLCTIKLLHSTDMIGLYRWV